MIRRAARSGVPYVLIEADRPTALALHDAGYRVMVGDPDNPDAYRRARVEQAALVAATMSDTANTNIAFTVREIDGSVPIVATASAAASVDILELAGCDHVLQLGEILGQAVARRVLGRSGVSQRRWASFGDLLVAEASAVHPDLLDRTLAESQVRQRVQVNVVGVWERGTYRAAGPRDARHRRCRARSSPARRSSWPPTTPPSPSPMPRRTGRDHRRRPGRAGRRRGTSMPPGILQIVDKREDRVRDPEHFVLGDAAELEVLERAGLRESSAVLITTHDDDVNVYLTIYCRRLEPDIQIISRANVDRNVGTLHRAGADAVLSYASLGASAIWNTLGPNDVLVLAEGLVVFRVPTPRAAGWPHPGRRPAAPAHRGDRRGARPRRRDAHDEPGPRHAAAARRRSDPHRGRGRRAAVPGPLPDPAPGRLTRLDEAGLSPAGRGGERPARAAPTV